MATLKSLSFTVFLGAVTLAAFRRTKLEPLNHKGVPQVAAFAMGLLLLKRLLLQSRKSKLIQDASRVGSDEEEYDYVVVGGGRLHP